MAIYQYWQVYICGRICRKLVIGDQCLVSQNMTYSKFLRDDEKAAKTKNCVFTYVLNNSYLIPRVDLFWWFWYDETHYPVACEISIAEVICSFSDFKVNSTVSNLNLQKLANNDASREMKHTLESEGDWFCRQSRNL